MIPPLEALPQIPPDPQAQLAMLQRHGDPLANLRHPFHQGLAPGGGQDIDGNGGIFDLEQLKQGVGHDHIADPGGADDEYGRGIMGVGRGQSPASLAWTKLLIPCSRVMGRSCSPGMARRWEMSAWVKF